MRNMQARCFILGRMEVVAGEAFILRTDEANRESDHPLCGLSRGAAWGPEKAILSDYSHHTGAITNILQKRSILSLWNPLP
jgi:hypothetical protein